MGDHMLKMLNKRTKNMLAGVALGCLATVSFVSPSQARPDFGEGLARFERGDYAGALQAWAPLALEGNADSLFNLGQMYRFGYGVEADKLKAKVFYNEAADRGHPAAERTLAADLFYADPAERDLDRSVQLFWSAAIKGDAPSQYMLATLYYSGEAVSRNLVQAWAWMKLANDNNYEDARGGLENIEVELSQNQLAQAQALSKTLILPERTWETPPMANTRVESFLRQFILAGGAAGGADANRGRGVTAMNPRTDRMSEIDPNSNSSFVPQLAGNWQIQLGSFRDQNRALAAGQRLEARLPDLTMEYSWVAEKANSGSNKGSFYRLKMQGFVSYSSADRICNTLIMNGFACMIVESE